MLSWIELEKVVCRTCLARRKVPTERRVASVLLGQLWSVNNVYFRYTAK